MAAAPEPGGPTHPPASSASGPAPARRSDAEPNLAATLPLHATDADTVLEQFLEVMWGRGLELYAAQEQAILELLAGKHVILSTPTGSGKSLVALALQYAALARGQRVFYTSPVKALVSEKFFALCEELGATNVGMLTGDASINRDAAVICCTAEVLANMALRDGGCMPQAVVMDEFHYYGDRDRGVAWQLPLLTLPQTQFLLMSATLGDTSNISKSLERRTQRPVARVHNTERPVPLDFSYRDTPLHETIADLLARDLAPIYLVNFTQRECAEQAQNLLSVDFCTKEQKKVLKRAVGGFRFDTPFGKDVARLVQHGLGIHHAGLLPKYRLLVEQLAQQGLLKIISGTDTLGVGVNVPIRTVLFTKLSKYDGEKVRILSVRDFKQIAGRAGRKGFDERGSVVCQAPEHVIENKQIAIKWEADPKKKKKLVKKKPPPGFVGWNEATFERLINEAPEPLESSFKVDHGVLLNLLQSDPNGWQGYRKLIRIIAESHESERNKSKHRRRAKLLFKSLRDANIVSVVRNRLKGNRIVINETLQRDFSLNHTLSLYLLEALPLLDPDTPAYPLDVLSLVEAILEHPRMVIKRQIDKLKSELLAELKAQGVDYEQRLEELDKVEHPKPNREFIYQTFDEFAFHHPWVSDSNIKPKSIAREMYERCMSFNEYIKEYKLQRAEGVLLRYLSNAYKTLAQNVPEEYKNDAVHEIEVYIRLLLERVDSSLITEWEQMRAGAAPTAEAAPEPTEAQPLFDPQRDPRGFRARLRNELHQLVRALARQDYETASSALRPGTQQWSAQELEDAMAPFVAEYGKLLFDHSARLPDKTRIEQVAPQQWDAFQTLVDPEGDNQWMIHANVDLNEPPSPDAPAISLVRIGV